jgi:hypothetical protein
MISEVEQRRARIVLGSVTAYMISLPGAVKRCSGILWPVKALEKTPRGVIPPEYVIYCQTLKKMTHPVFYNRENVALFKNL